MKNAGEIDLPGIDAAMLLEVTIGRKCACPVPYSLKKDVSLRCTGGLVYRGPATDDVRRGKAGEP